MEIKVGFEYETLVHVPDWNSFEQLCQRVLYYLNPALTFTGIKPYPQNASNEKNDPETDCMSFDDIQGDILVRFVLAAIYHRMQKDALFKIPFRVQKHYHGATCEAVPLAHTQVDGWLGKTGNNSSNANTGMKGNAWAITPDSSVVWCKKEKTDANSSPCQPMVVYESLNHFILQEHSNGMNMVQPNVLQISPQHTLEHVEIVSPPLTKQDIENGILSYVDGIMSANGKLSYYNNEKTSNHVHMSFNNGCGNVLLKSPESLLKVCMAWWYFEPIFMLLCGHWRRENEYAQGMRSILYDYFADPNVAKDMMTQLNEENFLDRLADIDLLTDEDLIYMGEDEYSERVYIQTIMNSIITLFQGDITERSSRYAALNLLNLTNDGIGTIEVRIKQGSNDPEENKNFILLVTEFFEHVLWDESKTPYSPSQVEASWQLWEDFLCRNRKKSTMDMNTNNARKQPNEWEVSTSLRGSFSSNPYFHTIAWNMLYELLEKIQTVECKDYWKSVFITLHGAPPAIGGKSNKKIKSRIK